MLTKLTLTVLLAIVMAVPSALTLAQSHDTGQDIVMNFNECLAKVVAMRLGEGCI